MKKHIPLFSIGSKIGRGGFDGRQELFGNLPSIPLVTNLTDPTLPNLIEGASHCLTKDIAAMKLFFSPTSRISLAQLLLLSFKSIGQFQRA